MGGTRHKAVVFVLFISACVLVFERALATAQRLPIRTYSSADGLAGDDITALLADSRGFLWIGTSTGLSRFDGTAFRSYGRSDGLPHLAVNDLIEDRNRAIWVGTQGGLVRIEAGQHTMSRIDLGPSIKPNIVRIRQARDGRIWIVAGSELYVMPDDGTPAGVRKIPLPAADPPTAVPLHIEALAEAPDGDLWIGTTAGLLRRRADGQILRLQVRPTPTDDRIYSLAIDAAGRVWITHWGLAHAPDVHFGVYVLAPRPGAHAHLDALTSLHQRARRITGSEPIALPETPGDVIYLTAGSPIGHQRAFGAVPTGDGVWIPTADGLVRVEREGTLRFNARHGIGLPIQVVAPDNRENLWLGTAGLGLVRFGLEGFATYGETAGFPVREISALLEDAAGNLCISGLEPRGARWFGTLANGVIERFQPHGTERVKYWGWGWQQVFLRDRQGDYWLATGEGLLRYPASRSCAAIGRTPPRAWYTREDGLPTNEVFRLFEDSRGDLWISAGGTLRWRRSTESFERLSEHSDAASAFAEDRAGQVWIGFYRGGVGRWRAGVFRYFDNADGVPTGYIYTLFVDAAGRLWIGSDSDGLVRIDDPAAEVPRFVRVTGGGTLTDMPVFALIEDAARRLYIATGQGVLQYSNTLALTRRYSRADGLPGYFVRTVYADRHGDLWFGTRTGLSRFTPRPEPPPPSLPVFIDRVAIAGVPQPTSLLGMAAIGGLAVPAHNRRVDISYGTATLAPGAMPQYSVRLKDVDSGWSTPTTDRAISYANLEPGSYQFEVKAAIDGRMSEVPAAVSFTILPPLWQRRSVQLSSALAVMALLYAAHRLRVQRLLMLERVRARVATDLHDDLGARLSRISILAEVAARRIRSDTVSAERLLGEVGNTARSLLETASDITWCVDPQHDQLGSLATRIRRFAADMLDGRNIKWTFETQADGGAIRLTAEYRRHVLLVFQEAVNNVVRHSRARRVRLALTIVGNQLIAVIKDDGCGFERNHGAERAAAGNGLTNMSRRAREIGGVLAIRSAPGAGTEVYLSAPLP